MADTKPHESSVAAAAWSPLAVPAFRTVWIAVLISNIGGWMASVATAWLMTTLDPSPLTVSLVSAATGLPLFLFALPAVLARRGGRTVEIGERARVGKIAPAF